MRMMMMMMMKMLEVVLFSPRQRGGLKKCWVVMIIMSSRRFADWGWFDDFVPSASIKKLNLDWTDCRLREKGRQSDDDDNDGDRDDDGCGPVRHGLQGSLLIRSWRRGSLTSWWLRWWGLQCRIGHRLGNLLSTFYAAVDIWLATSTRRVRPRFFCSFIISSSLCSGFHPRQVTWPSLGDFLSSLPIVVPDTMYTGGNDHAMLREMLRMMMMMMMITTMVTTVINVCNG